MKKNSPIRYLGCVFSLTVPEILQFTQKCTNKLMTKFSSIDREKLLFTCQYLIVWENPILIWGHKINQY